MEKSRATILGSFDTLENGVGSAIRKTLSELGVDTLRMDPIRPEPLTEAFAKAIISSDFVIADMSKQSSNLMYELGLAHGFRKPTILIMSSQSPAQIPTDLAGNFFLFYDPHDLSGFGNKLRKLISPHIV
jgi:hypothetical protein